MKIRFLARLLVAISMVASLTAVAVAQQPTTSTTPTNPSNSPEGSEEKVRVTPFSSPDEKHGAAVSVFEAVASADNPTQKRLYLSPLCRLIPFDEKGKPYEAVGLSDGRTRFQLRILYYYPDLFAQAASRINSLYKTGFRKEQISLLAVSMIKHEIVGFPGIRPGAVGDLGARVQLPESKVIQFDVSAADLDTVKKLAASPGGLQVNSTLYYNALNLKKKAITWTVEDIRNTRAFRDLSTGGVTS